MLGYVCIDLHARRDLALTGSVRLKCVTIHFDPSDRWLAVIN